MQLRVVTWTRSAASVEDELGALIDALRGQACDILLVHRVPRTWPRSLARALGGEYRQMPPAREPPPLLGRLRRRPPGDAVAVLARQDRIIAAHGRPMPLLAVRLASGPWVVAADVGDGPLAGARSMDEAVGAVLAWAGDEAVVLAVAAGASPAGAGALRHVAGHPGGHVFVTGPVELTAGHAARAAGSAAIVADLRVGAA